jgi:hypothetical protein
VPLRSCLFISYLVILPHLVIFYLTPCILPTDGHGSLHLAATASTTAPKIDVDVFVATCRQTSDAAAQTDGHRVSTTTGTSTSVGSLKHLETDSAALPEIAGTAADAKCHVKHINTGPAAADTQIDDDRTMNVHSGDASWVGSEPGVSESQAVKSQSKPPREPPVDLPVEPVPIFKAGMKPVRQLSSAASCLPCFAQWTAERFAEVQRIKCEANAPRLQNAAWRSFTLKCRRRPRCASGLASAAASDDQPETMSLQPEEPSAAASADQPETMSLQPEEPSAAASADQPETMSLQPEEPSAAASADQPGTMSLQPEEPSAAAAADQPETVSLQPEERSAAASGQNPYVRGTLWISPSFTSGSDFDSVSDGSYSTYSSDSEETSAATAAHQSDTDLMQGLYQGQSDSGSDVDSGDEVSSDLCSSDSDGPSAKYLEPEFPPQSVSTTSLLDTAGTEALLRAGSDGAGDTEPLAQVFSFLSDPKAPPQSPLPTSATTACTRISGVTTEASSTS